MLDRSSDPRRRLPRIIAGDVAARTAASPRAVFSARMPFALAILSAVLVAIFPEDILPAALSSHTVARADGRALDPSLFRIFLKDGTTLACYGEFARVGERVVFTLPLGEGHQHLASVGAAEVDWPRTDGYAYAVRAAHYAATRGDAEFSAMSTRLAGVLTEIARAADPAEQLRRAEEARRELAEWPSRHYGYRSNEIRETLGVLDEVVAGLRAKTSRTRFEISLVAGAAPPPMVTLLGAPSLQDSIAQALRLATLAESPTERVELLRSAVAALDAHASSRLETWAISARRRIRETLELETATDRAYALLATRTLALADRRVRHADVRGLAKLRTDVLARNARLGGKRPQQLDALLATLDRRLEAAQRLRLARDQWALKSNAFRRYRSIVASPLDLLRRAQAPLNDIRALAGPSADTLTDLGRRLDRQQPGLRTMFVPADLRGAHASLVSAWQLAAAAVRQRQRAVAANDLALAQNASAAAAGALMLFERVQTEIARVLEAPQLP
jgi:hypothetical protein